MLDGKLMMPPSRPTRRDLKHYNHSPLATDRQVESHENMSGYVSQLRNTMIAYAFQNIIFG